MISTKHGFITPTHKLMNNPNSLRKSEWKRDQIRMKMAKTPINRIEFSGTKIVRYIVANHQFEIVCFKDKLQNWFNNNKETTDLNQVLDIYEIFSSATKGELAKPNDIKKYLHSEKDKAIQMILENGNTHRDTARQDINESARSQVAKIINLM